MSWSGCSTWPWNKWRRSWFVTDFTSKGNGCLAAVRSAGLGPAEAVLPAAVGWETPGLGKAPLQASAGPAEAAVFGSQKSSSVCVCQTFFKAQGVMLRSGSYTETTASVVDQEEGKAVLSHQQVGANSYQSVSQYHLAAAKF